MRELEVYLRDRHVGRIMENRKGARFAYDEQIVETSTGLPLLSLCMPVKRRPFGENKTRNWFEGLLPEGQRRDEICRTLGIIASDWIGLLAAIGWECAGAVGVYDEADAHAHAQSYIPLSADDLALRLADVSVRRYGRRGEALRMSLGGYQDKLCVRMPRLAQNTARVDAMGTCIPAGDAASTHILKPEPADYPGLALSEAWAMASASHAARCSHVAILDLPDAPATLVVERYDRIADNEGDVIRLHQEDACQALGLAPERKYASGDSPKGDDPSYAAIAKLLVQYATDPAEELAELFRQMAVNVALGNWDAHAKNTSFLYLESYAPTVAPLYDVVPIVDVEPRTNMLSLRIAGKLDPNAVTGETLVAEAESWGIVRGVAEGLLEETLSGLEAGFSEASKRFPDAAGRHEEGARTRMRRLAL